MPGQAGEESAARRPDAADRHVELRADLFVVVVGPVQQQLEQRAGLARQGLRSPYGALDAARPRPDARPEEPDREPARGSAARRAPRGSAPGASAATPAAPSSRARPSARPDPRSGRCCGGAGATSSGSRPPRRRGSGGTRVPHRGSCRRSADDLVQAHWSPARAAATSAATEPSSRSRSRRAVERTGRSPGLPRPRPHRAVCDGRSPRAGSGSARQALGPRRTRRSSRRGCSAPSLRPPCRAGCLEPRPATARNARSPRGPASVRRAPRRPQPTGPESVPDVHRRRVRAPP